MAPKVAKRPASVTNDSHDPSSIGPADVPEPPRATLPDPVPTGALAKLLETIGNTRACVTQSVEAGMPEVYVQEHQATVIMSLIAGVPHLTSAQGTLVGRELNATPLTIVQKQQLMQQILTVVQAHAGTQAAEASAGGTKFQTCLILEKALTQAEWQGLESHAVVPAKIDQLATRLWTLGVVNPSEPTTFHCAKLLALMEKVSDAQQIEDFHVQIKRAVKKIAAKPHPLHPVHYITDYGNDIHALPAQLFQYAYPGDAPAQPHTCRRLASIGLRLNATRMHPCTRSSWICRPSLGTLMPISSTSYA